MSGRAPRVKLAALPGMIDRLGVAGTARELGVSVRTISRWLKLIARPKVEVANG